MSVRQRISNILKYIIVFSALGGTVYGLFTATGDGYSHWSKRLLYFTTQSNVWVGIIYLIIIISSLFNKERHNELKDTLYYCKYVFIVSIAMTCLVFCCFLGPFADESYHPWSLYSFFAHVITPVLAIVEFFLDEFKYQFRLKHLFMTTIAPLIYFIISIVLCVFRLDFGRGEPFPYFFLDISSNVGFFGFTTFPRPNMGVVWWILFFSIVMLSIGQLLIKTHHSSIKKKSIK